MNLECNNIPTIFSSCSYKVRHVKRITAALSFLFSVNKSDPVCVFVITANLMSPMLLTRMVPKSRRIGGKPSQFWHLCISITNSALDLHCKIPGSLQSHFELCMRFQMQITIYLVGCNLSNFFQIQLRLGGPREGFDSGNVFTRLHDYFSSIACG